MVRVLLIRDDSQSSATNIHLYDHSLNEQERRVKARARTFVYVYLVYYRTSYLVVSSNSNAKCEHLNAQYGELNRVESKLVKLNHLELLD